MFCKPPHPPHPVYIVIFRGDDTDFVGNQEILVKIHTERDISGCKAYFKYMGNVQTFDEIPEDKELHLVFSREQTKDMPLGTWDAELYLIDEQGRRMTVNNRIHMLVTNSVHEAYFPDDPQAVTVVINSNKYVEDAEVSADGKTLTLTKKDGTEVTFRGGGGGGGTDDYNDLENKPSINLITLKGDRSSDDLGLQSKLDVSEEGVYNISVQEAVTSERASSDANGEDIISTYARKDDTYRKTEVNDKLALKQDALSEDQIDILDGGPYVNSDGVIKNYTPEIVSEIGVSSIDSYGIESSIRFTTGNGPAQSTVSVKDYDSEEERSFLFPLKSGGRLATDEQVEAVSEKVDEIKDTVSTDNRFLVNGTTAAIQTRTDETAEWTDEIRVDKGYDAVQGDAMVKLDKSVQTVTVSGGTLTVELPDAVDGTVRDLCLYINNTSPTETVTMTFPAGVTVYKSKGGDDPKAAAQAGGITAYYFTEIPGGAWRVMRDELEVAT